MGSNTFPTIDIDAMVRPLATLFLTPEPAPACGLQSLAALKDAPSLETLRAGPCSPCSPRLRTVGYQFSSPTVIIQDAFCCIVKHCVSPASFFGPKGDGSQAPGSCSHFAQWDALFGPRIENRVVGLQDHTFYFVVLHHTFSHLGGPQTTGNFFILSQDCLPPPPPRWTFFFGSTWFSQTRRAMPQDAHRSLDAHFGKSAVVRACQLKNMAPLPDVAACPSSAIGCYAVLGG